MTIRLRILALLSLLSLVCLGIFWFFNLAQDAEEAAERPSLTGEVSARLAQLVAASAQPAWRSLRTAAAADALQDFIAHPDREGAGRSLPRLPVPAALDSLRIFLPDGRELSPGAPAVSDSGPAAPLTRADWAALFRHHQPFSFFAVAAGDPIQVLGLPVAAPTQPAFGNPAAGWLVAVRRWDRPFLATLAAPGRGRLILTPPNDDDRSGARPEASGWLPLLDQHRQAVAGLAFVPAEPPEDKTNPETVERMLFLVNSVGAVLLVGVLLHYWILRPFSCLQSSLVARQPGPLAPLLPQANEFGQMARLVQSAMRDREQLELSLAGRVRLARELHDGAIQGIYGAGMALSRVPSLMKRDPAAAELLLDETRTELNRIIGDLRVHIEQADPKPPDSTFRETVERLIQQLRGPAPLETELDIDETLVAQLPPLDRSQLLQFVREAVSNALRHGRPTRLAVTWRPGPPGSVLTVQDDGLGFDPATLAPGGRGLGNLNERAIALGGRLDLESRPHHGTRIRLHLRSRQPAS